MSAISGITLTPTNLALPPVPAAPGPAAPSGAPSGDLTSRDAQIADLGATSSQVNALQSLAMQQPPMPISIPQTKHNAPPQAAMSDELIAPPAGDDAD